MNTFITKSGSEIKAEVGTYFELINRSNYSENPDTNFLEKFDRLFFRNTLEKLDFFYNLFNGKMKSNHFVQVKEHLYEKYGSWFADDSHSVFMNKNEIISYLTEEIMSTFDSFMEKNNKKIVSKIINEDKFLKPVLMQFSFSKKLDFLNQNYAAIKNQTVENWVNIEVIPALKEGVNIKLPANWNDLLKTSDSQDLYIIHNNKMNLIKNCNLLHIFYDEKEESLYLKYELNSSNSNIPVRFSNYFYDNTTQKYTFEKSVYLTEDEAKTDFAKLIEDRESELVKMKSLLAA